jgi:hypothetical protein
MSSRFCGSWALITGASSGLGEEFARQLAAQGAHVILTARSTEKLTVLARKLSAAHHVETAVVPADLSEVGGAARLCRNIDLLRRPVDHLINNAGFGDAGPFARADADVHERMVRVNCEALVRLSRHFLPGMLERRRGGIVHVASTAAHQPVPYMATYGASKAFVLSFSLALAEEAREKGVTVCALCPGPVPTGFQAVAGIGHTALQRVAALSADETVRRAIAAYEDRAELCVPGAFNTVQTLSSKFLPRSLVTRGAGEAMRRMGRAR